MSSQLPSDPSGVIARPKGRARCVTLSVEEDRRRSENFVIRVGVAGDDAPLGNELVMLVTARARLLEGVAGLLRMSFIEGDSIVYGSLTFSTIANVVKAVEVACRGDVRSANSGST